jgi:hypothetical protein
VSLYTRTLTPDLGAPLVSCTVASILVLLNSIAAGLLLTVYLVVAWVTPFRATFTSAFALEVVVSIVSN